MQHHQYRAYAPHVAQQVPQQVPQRSPHTSSQRRGGIGPMMPSATHPQQQQQPSQAQIAQQHQAAMHASEWAKRRSRKPTDKNMPEGVEDSIIDPEAVQRYKDLRDVERRLDATMTRKRMDLVDGANRPSKLQKTLRISVTNTVEDQVWQGNGLNVDAFDFTPSMESSFRVKIQGRLLDSDSEDGTNDDKEEATLKDEADGETAEPDGPPAGEKKAPSPETSKPRFSHFFRSISVDFDASRIRNGNELNVEWKKPDNLGRNQSALPASADFDEFTFKRNGDENMNITISLYRQESPERYQLSPELADVVDMREGTQQDAVMGLWEYVRVRGLQEDEEKRNFRCDDLLKKVVRRGEIGYIPLLNEYVTQHLSPLPPVQLKYTIRVDEEFHSKPEPTVYDVQVSVEDPMRAQVQSLLNQPQYATMLKEVNQLDDQLARIVQAISVSKAKHSFLESLSQDPANFIRNWLSSQKRDVDVVMGESTRSSGEAVNSDEWRKGGAQGVWATQNARESINVLLSKQR